MKVAKGLSRAHSLAVKSLDGARVTQYSLIILGCGISGSIGVLRHERKWLVVLIKSLGDERTWLERVIGGLGELELRERGRFPSGARGGGDGEGRNERELDRTPMQWN